MTKSISPRLKAKYYRQVLEYVESHEITGLCYAVVETSMLHRWNFDTLDSMLLNLRKNKPRMTQKVFFYHPYWWQVGDKKERIRFLKKLIKKNELKPVVNMILIMAFCAVVAACLIGVLAVFLP